MIASATHTPPRARQSLVGDLLVMARLSSHLPGSCEQTPARAPQPRCVSCDHGSPAPPCWRSGFCCGTACRPCTASPLPSGFASAAGGLLCTASTTLLWNWSLTQIPASEAGVFLNLEPIIGSVLSVWLFHERLGWTAALGGGLIVASAIVMTTQSKPAMRETAGQVPAME